MKLVSLCDRVIEYSFYALFFLVPLFFTNNTSELFELNKMWLTWGLSVLIIGAWLIKMFATKRFFIQRTPLDIPLVFFLLSQLISTIFSLDQRISFWGYYSRFNGGFLSLLTYVLLYFAFVSNSTREHVLRILKVSLLSGLLVALWGLPSHFGHDPTCLMFRGTFDVSCWTEAFKPTIRIFSTLGQPAWMAAYMALLIPLAVAFFLRLASQKIDRPQLTLYHMPFTKKSLIFALCALLLAGLFYLDLLYSDTRAGFIAFWLGNILFWIVLWWKNVFSLRKLLTYAIIVNVLFLFFNFTSGTPISQLNVLSLKNLHHTASQTAATATPTTGTSQSLDVGGTDSGTIRLLVWRGAIDIWKAHPLFGSGVETYAFAYYKYRPAAHNMTSEWDYLYNKAHNEYLNYLATTGAVGLGTYLLILGVFAFIFLRSLFPREDKQITPEQAQKDELIPAFRLLSVGLFAGWVTILITNFFGFSVVIMNLYLFLIPAFYFFLNGLLDPKRSFVKAFGAKEKTSKIGPYQWTGIVAVFLVALYCLIFLVRFWQADTVYALGSNLDRAGQFQQAYPLLAKAVQIKPQEPVYQDEYSINLATLGTALMENNEATTGAQLAQQAMQLSNDIVAHHPNNVVFWKSRVRIFYLLSQVDPQYLSSALAAIEKAHELAPTDAKIAYNLGVLYGQNNKLQQAIDTLTETIKLKPDYRDPYYARALFYHQEATDSNGNVVKPELQQKAVADLQFILKYFGKDEQAQKMLDSWGGRTK
jgi:Flp pilus assembly protein TadD/O-antigen ligase